jgi:hypothetical protein
VNMGLNAVGLAVVGLAVNDGSLAGANLSIRALYTTASVRASGIGFGTAIAGFAAHSASFDATNIVIYVSQSILKLTCAQQGSGAAVLGAGVDDSSNIAVAFVVVSCADSNVSLNSGGSGFGAAALGVEVYNSHASVNDLRIYAATSTLVMSTKNPATTSTSALGFASTSELVATQVLIQQCAVTYNVGYARVGDLSSCSTNCTVVTTLAPCVPLTAPVDEAIAPLLAQDRVGSADGTLRPCAVTRRNEKVLRCCGVSQHICDRNANCSVTAYGHIDVDSPGRFGVAGPKNRITVLLRLRHE